MERDAGGAGHTISTVVEATAKGTSTMKAATNPDPHKFVARLPEVEASRAQSPTILVPGAMPDPITW